MPTRGRNKLRNGAVQAARGQTTATVLSLRQPFADFVIFGQKWCENRSWQTAYRGDLFIHASSWDAAATRDHLETSGLDVKAKSPSGAATGAILGKVTLLDVLTGDEIDRVGRFLDRKLAGLDSRLQRVAKHIRWYDPETWEYASGPYCFVLVNPKPLLAPIRAKGNLRLWKTDVDPTALQFRDWRPGYPYGKERM